MGESQLLELHLYIKGWKKKTPLGQQMTIEHQFNMKHV